jgi:hypothetical protein
MQPFRPSARWRHPPERAADCAGIGSTVEDRTNDFGLARASIAMLAEIAVEAQRRGAYWCVKDCYGAEQSPGAWPESGLLWSRNASQTSLRPMA